MPLLAAAIPPITVARAVCRYGVNVPFADQWQFVPLLIDAVDGRLRWSALWAQHNEHRIVLPRLVMLALARPSRWDVRWEMAMSMVIGVIAVAVVAALVYRTVGLLAPSAVPWLVVMTSTLCFSLSAWENWIWGWQVQILMVVLAASLAACGLRIVIFDATETSDDLVRNVTEVITSLCARPIRAPVRVSQGGHGGRDRPART